MNAQRVAEIVSVLGCVAVFWLLALGMRERNRDRRRAEQLDAAVRAQAIVESIPLRGVTVRGASRDRSVPGKARRRARRL